MTYDNEGKLLNANVTDTTTSAILHQYAYLYDAAGNRTSEQIDGNVTGSSYNNLNQLTGQSAGGKMVFNGTLSKPSVVTVGGNPATSGYYSTNFTGIASVTQGTNNVPIIASDVNGNVSTNKYQVVIPSTSGSYAYDLNGNLLTDGSKTYSYDAKNELVKITYADTSYTAFTYNGSGARVEIQEYNSSHTLTSTKWFVGNEERDGSNVTTRRYFSQGEQRISGGTSTNYFYTHDHLGSIREMIDASGTIQARYSYDPFGRRTKVSGSLDCDFGFTGYYHHTASSLDLSATRAYDSNTGRFTQRDPSGEGSGLNLYAYCGGDPINHTDSSGLCADDGGLGQYGYDLLRNTANDVAGAAADAYWKMLLAAMIADGVAAGLAAEEVAATRAAGSSLEEDEEAEANLIYRKGSATNNNLTPRPQDTDGLSTAVNPPPGKSQAIDPSKFNQLKAVQDGPNHVSIVPKDAARMAEWIESRASNIVHEFTEEVRNAIVGTTKQ